MHHLHERAHENERTILTYLASFDCLTKRLIALLLHGEETNSSVTYAEKITKRMISRGLIGRKIAGDGVFRYFLAERGTYEAAELLRFEPRNGHERSYLNAARFDSLHETVIRDMHEKYGTGFGKGALRHLRPELRDIDAALVVDNDENRVFAYFYMKIDTLAESTLTRFDRAKQLAIQHGARIKIIGPDFVRKKLAKR
ncbi:hypothetical protein [Paraburkholderia tropica]|uniref:hypothetical protein n=1 Tax=Paraburkholderia tropica TaxID=92647 RepID=UPI002ABE66C1|nr:hypothetical protein [Paraburkholderia tropica]